MRQWQGIKDSETDVAGDGAINAIGVSFLVEGELRRRPGLTKSFPVGGRAIGAFRSSVNGAWVVLSTNNGNLTAVNLATPTASTTLKSSYDVLSHAIFCYVNGRLYITNNFDRVQVWDGIWATTQDAGIAAPSAAAGAPATGSGSLGVGTHLFRYRYLDNTSPASTYRSNASAVLSVSVTTAANAALTFGIGTAVTTSTPIVRSQDAKVTTIQGEITAAAGSVYYVTGTVNNTATSLVVNVTDANLVLNELGGLYDSGNSLTTDDLGTGNEQPPLGSIITQCRDYIFLGGDKPYATSVTATAGSASVTGSGFSPQWNTRKVIRIGTDTASYQVSSVNAAGTIITLVNNYAGSTQTTTASVYSQNPNAIYWSAFIGNRGAVMPESWRAAARSRSVLNGTGDTLKGMVEFNGDLIICGRFTMQRLVFVDDPGAGEPDILSGQFGVWTQRCLLKVEGVLYGWGPNGVWMARGGMPQWISRDIESTYKTYYDYFNMDSAWAVYDPGTKSIRWFFLNFNDGEVRETIAWDLAGKRWVREQYRQGFSAGLCTADPNGILQCLLSDESNGFTFTREGATDGVPSGTGSYTVGSGSTTTVTQVTDSLPTGTSLTDLSKLVAYDPVSGEERVIASNTSSAITHAAFTSALTAGASLYVGAIPWIYETDWWIGDGMENAKRPTLFMEVNPGSVTGKLKVTFYADGNATALTFTTEATYDAPFGILPFTSGQAYLEAYFDNTTLTSGFLKFPHPADWRRKIRAKVEVISPTGTLKVNDIYFALQAKQDSKVKSCNE